MDEETSARMRDALRDAIARQRPQPDTEAAKQQMLVTTLRLAGHTVNLTPHELPESRDADQPDDTHPADGTAGLTETSSDVTAGTGNPLIHDGLDRIDDPSRPADDGKAQLLPFIFDDPTRPADHGKPQLMPEILANPTLPAGGGLPRPQPIRGNQPFVMPAGAVPDESEQYAVPDDETGSSPGGLEIMPDDSDGFAPPAADAMSVDRPLDSDEPPPLSIAVDDESADPAPSPAPGTKPFFPSPGAGSSSFLPSFGGDGGDGDDDSQSSNSEGGSDDSQTPGAQPAIVVVPTEILTEQLIQAATEAVSPLAQKTVDLAISDLRHEIYVSRAARNALFPR